MSTNVLKIDGKTFKFSTLTKQEKWEAMCLKMSSIDWNLVDAGVYQALIDELAATNMLSETLTGTELEENRSKAEYLTDILYDVASENLAYPYTVFAVFPNKAGEEHFSNFYKADEESGINFRLMARRLTKISPMKPYSHMQSVLDPEGLPEFETSALYNLMVDIEFWKPPFSYQQQTVYLQWQLSLLSLAFPKYGPTSVRGMFLTPEGPIGYLINPVSKNVYNVITFSVFQRDDLTMMELARYFADYYVTVNLESKHK
jgi:hypothetical protein